MSSLSRVLTIGAPLVGLTVGGLLIYERCTRYTSRSSWLLKKHNCILITDKDFDDTGILAFQQSWRQLKNSHKDTINLVIHSYGGNMWCAMAILQIILRHVQLSSERAKVVAWVPYVACSSAMLPVLASDEIYLHEDAVLGPCDAQIGMVAYPLVSPQAYLSSDTKNDKSDKSDPNIVSPVEEKSKSLKDHLNRERARRVLDLDETIMSLLRTTRKWSEKQFKVLQKLFWDYNKCHWTPIEPSQLRDALSDKEVLSGQTVTLCKVMPKWVAKLI